MDDHYKLTDTEFEEKFANEDFEVSMFTHEAHLRLAWIHIDRYGLVIAEQNVSDQLKTYTKHVGVPNKFHMTLTIAAVKAVSHCYSQYKGRDFKDFIERWPALKEDFKPMMESHYSFDIFKSHEARSNYISPDLRPFN